MRPRKTTFEERAAALKARLTSGLARVVGIEEEPLTVAQAAKRWGQSPKATRRFFRDVSGVRIINHPYRYDPKRKRYVQKYETVLIPPSVLEREILKVTKVAA